MRIGRPDAESVNVKTNIVEYEMEHWVQSTKPMEPLIQISLYFSKTAVYKISFHPKWVYPIVWLNTNQYENYASKKKSSGEKEHSRELLTGKLIVIVGMIINRSLTQQEVIWLNVLTGKSGV